MFWCKMGGVLGGVYSRESDEDDEYEVEGVDMGVDMLYFQERSSLVRVYVDL